MNENRFKAIKELLSLYSQGQMIVVTDNEDRENEGDLLISSEKICEQDVAFMAQYGRGLICISIEKELAQRLNLPLMSQSNNSQYSTAFTISVDAREGTTTGISASDRLKTIKTVISENTKENDLLRPGHMFPLISAEGGLNERAGHTEAAVELSKMVGHVASAVICEIMGDDGSMLKGKSLKEYSQKFKLPMLSIEELIEYKKIVEKPKSTHIPSDYGDFDLYDFYNKSNSQMPHIALIHKEANLSDPLYLRIHSECLTGDLFGSLKCDCGDQLKKSMKIINENKGALIYLRQEGRGIGFNKKMEAYRLQEQGLDTIEANLKLGFTSDDRDYEAAAQILESFAVKSVILITNNPEKINFLEDRGISVLERIPLETSINEFNIKYLNTKKNKMNHILSL